jgi:hypothetical protein
MIEGVWKETCLTITGNNYGEVFFKYLERLKALPGTILVSELTGYKEEEGTVSPELVY